MARAAPLALAALVVAAGLLAGCTGKGTQSVSNNPDNFRFTGQFEGKGGTERYRWENSRAQATVSMPYQAAAGSVGVRVLDAAGSEVYTGASGSGQGTLSGPTRSTNAGTWTVELRFSGFTGQVTLTVRTA